MTNTYFIISNLRQNFKKSRDFGKNVHSLRMQDKYTSVKLLKNRTFGNQQKQPCRDPGSDSVVLIIELKQFPNNDAKSEYNKLNCYLLITNHLKRIIKNGKEHY